MVVASLLVACTPPTPSPGDGSVSTHSSVPTGTTGTTGTTGDTSSPGSTGHTGRVDTGAPTDLPPNVLLLVADDYGVDHVAAYEATTYDIHTPNLDALAAQGRMFSNAWGYGSCSPGRASLTTGRHGRRTGYGLNWRSGDPPYILDPAEDTLPELVARSPLATWQSALLGKWHLGAATLPDVEQGPHSQGWEFFAGTLGSTLKDPAYPGGPEGDYFGWSKVLDDESKVWQTGYATTDTADDAIARIQAMSEPWLLEVSFNAIHAPMQAPPQALVTYPLGGDPDLRLVGAAMAEAMDTEIGRVLASMSPELRARTTVIFVGDNGTNQVALVPPAPNERIKLSKGTLHDMGVRVPFIVTGPLVQQPGVPSDALVSLVDVFPTLAAIAGVDPATLPVLDGVSLLPALADPTVPVHSTLYTELFGPVGSAVLEQDRFAMRDERYKITVDLFSGEETFHEYVPGRFAEGLNLLPDLTPTQELAHAELRAALYAQRTAMIADLPVPP